MSNKQQDLYIPPRPRCEEMNFSEYGEDYIITVPQGIRENSQKNTHDELLSIKSIKLYLNKSIDFLRQIVH